MSDWEYAGPPAPGSDLIIPNPPKEAGEILRVEMHPDSLTVVCQHQTLFLIIGQSEYKTLEEGWQELQESDWVKEWPDE